MDPEELRANAKKFAITASFFAVALLFFALGWRTALVLYVVVVGVLATLAILIQSGKGGGLAASLGGVGADSLLGTHSATPIAKATYVMLALCIFILLLVARMGSSGEGAESFLLLDDSPPEAAVPYAPLPGTPTDGPAAPGTTEALPPGEPALND